MEESPPKYKTRFARAFFDTDGAVGALGWLFLVIVGGIFFVCIIQWRFLTWGELATCLGLLFIAAVAVYFSAPTSKPRKRPKNKRPQSTTITRSEKIEEWLLKNANREWPRWARLLFEVGGFALIGCFLWLRFS